MLRGEGGGGGIKGSGHIEWRSRGEREIFLE